MRAPHPNAHLCLRRVQPVAFALAPIAFAGISALLVGVTLAAFILFRSPPRATNWLLALVVALEGIGLGAGGGLIYTMTESRDAAGMQAIFVTCFIALPFLYLVLLSYLPSPLARPLRPMPVRVGILAIGLVVEILWLLNTEAFIPAMVTTWYAPWEGIIGPGFELALAFGGLVSLYAVATALTAIRATARGTAARAQAKAYALAFVFRDVYIFAAALLLPILVGLPPTGTLWDLAYVLVAPAFSVVFMGVLSYGILRTQLFDIDLHLKVTLSRGAIAAVFLGVFFVVAELAQTYLSNAYGWAIGGLAAGLLLFALAPLQRAAERLANVAMPSVSGSADYVAARKFFVYRAALEAALADGGVTRKERAMLARLQQELGLRPEDVAQLESDVAAAAT